MESHLEEYLNYYKNREAPGYAVLVTGEWGTGKTYQVRKIFEKDEEYYVSLFGLQTADDVHAAVLAVMDPKMAKVKSFVGGAGKAAEGLGGLASLLGTVPKMLNAVFRQNVNKKRTIIFDDLERCNINTKDKLGVINTYVEHHHCRVVVIAHDEKIVGEFNVEKEKLFGQTIKVEPNISAAFGAFCSKFFKDKNDILGPEKLKFVTTHNPAIIEIFKDSEAGSLRILRHVIEDLGRLFESLDKEHLEKLGVMDTLVRLFSALNIEVRSGFLVEADLRDRRNAVQQHYAKQTDSKTDQSEEPNFLVADKKYGSVGLNDNLLHDDLIIQMLIEGRYDKETICSSLNDSPYFLKPEEAPPWRVVMDFDQLEDEVLNVAIEAMQAQFENRTVTVPGEMLQIFTLRMLMSKEGELDDDIVKIIDGCKLYIDDLLAADRLPAKERGSRGEHGLATAYGGCQYWDLANIKEQFKEIFEHLIDARAQAFEKQFPEIVVNLLDLVKSDGNAFREHVSYTNAGENLYAGVPVLSEIAPKDFVDAWLVSPKANWREVFYALGSRYETGHLDRELKAEKDWAREVVKLLEQKAAEVKGFQALRIQRIIPSVMRPEKAEE